MDAIALRQDEDGRDDPLALSPEFSEDRLALSFTDKSKNSCAMSRPWENGSSGMDRGGKSTIRS